MSCILPQDQGRSPALTCRNASRGSWSWPWSPGTPWPRPRPWAWRLPGPGRSARSSGPPWRGSWGWPRTCTPPRCRSPRWRAAPRPRTHSPTCQSADPGRAAADTAPCDTSHLPRNAWSTETVVSMIIIRPETDSPWSKAMCARRAGSQWHDRTAAPGEEAGGTRSPPAGWCCGHREPLPETDFLLRCILVYLLYFRKSGTFKNIARKCIYVGGDPLCCPHTVFNYISGVE